MLTIGQTEARTDVYYLLARRKRGTHTEMLLSCSPPPSDSITEKFKFNLQSNNLTTSESKDQNSLLDH